MVLSGTWWVNSGADFAPADTVLVPAGGFVKRAARTFHYDGVPRIEKEPVVVAVFGIGPVDMELADPKTTLLASGVMTHRELRRGEMTPETFRSVFGSPQERHRVPSHLLAASHFGVALCLLASPAAEDRHELVLGGPILRCQATLCLLRFLSSRNAPRCLARRRRSLAERQE